MIGLLLEALSTIMDFGESILDSLDEELSCGDGEDVEMMEVEDGEVVDRHIVLEITDKNDKEMKTDLQNGNPQPAKNMNNKKRRKKKNKRKKGIPISDDVVDMDRFVMGVCKQLREQKSYLVYTAVGILGVSAIKDLVKEVHAVQACGGQKTSLGDRCRTGGGVLWNILKARDPNAYKEIMKKGREFEKEFRRASMQPHGASGAITSKRTANTSNDVEIKTPAPEQSAQPSTEEEKRTSVHYRIRVPVTYDDLPGEEPVEGI
ncbi:hypothetical protein BVRB_2g033190 [Beta vulgaris subsp. vulgaris]|uniref:Phosphorylated adapter RNA export protein n=1 Tax=Beta vulgaris subsp. vulgaris TaxID=3555 RepID=A0A0J8D1E5_BETVV|nr:hypothetical protein BVRB_2g033190 [Beta vulgaris subsp. vulgaris]